MHRSLAGAEADAESEADVEAGEYDEVEDEDADAARGACTTSGRLANASSTARAMGDNMG